jgi:acyl-CoA thioester hydrolase
MIEVARNSVQTWETDLMGHMNVQFYMEKATHGLAALGLALGLALGVDPRGGHRLKARTHHVRFLRERRAGAPFYIRAGVLAVEEDGLQIYQEMVGTRSGEVAAAFTADVELEENNGAPCALPAAVREKASELRVELPEHGRPRGLELYPPRPEPSMGEADTLGLIPTLQCQIQPSQCDDEGRLLTRHFMGLVSDAVPNLITQVQGDIQSRPLGTGGAALEYRLIYRAHSRPGDVIVVRSGLRTVSSKTYVWTHWLFDLASGACVSTAEAVAIGLDLETRKAVALSETARQELAKKVIPELSV